MSSGVVPHYRPCLLVWYLTLGYACWSFLHFWLVECRRKRNGYTSGASLTEVPIHQTCLLIRCHSQTCLQIRCGSHGFVKLISYQPGRHLEYIKFWVMHKLHHWDVTSNSSISKISILHANPWIFRSLWKFSYIFVINCHFGGHFD